MASFVYDHAMADMVSGLIDLDSDVLKVMLVNGSYTPNKDDQFIGSGVGSPHAAEIVATNYAGGFGGAGRKTATVTISDDTANDRAIAVFGNLTWTALGGAANDTVVGAILVKEITNDAASKLIAYWDITDTPTNGGNFTLTMDGTNGNLQFNC
jgi:hypothetical protein